MINLAGGGYSHDEVLAALLGKTSARTVAFRYDLLDRYDRRIKTLDCVMSADVLVSAFATIKRTARFTIREDPAMDYLSHRIQPFFRLRMPNGGWREWPLGIYLLSSPKRQEKSGVIYREIEAYDGLQVLVDDKFATRYTIPAGTNIVTAIKTILTDAGIIKTNIQSTTKTVPVDKEFEPGTTRLEAVNALLDMLNYIPLYVDANGYYTSHEYVSPAQQAPIFTYSDGALSVLFNGLSYELDLFGVPNMFVVYTSSPDVSSLRSVYTNVNPASPLSTISRGRTIVDIRQVDDIADQATLDAYVQRIAFEASQVYGYIEMETALMPFHDVGDVVRVEYSPLGIYENFAETEWSMPLKAGGRMKHKLRRVVNVL